MTQQCYISPRVIICSWRSVLCLLWVHLLYLPCPNSLKCHTRLQKMFLLGLRLICKFCFCISGLHPGIWCAICCQHGDTQARHEPYGAGLLLKGSSDQVTSKGSSMLRGNPGLSQHWKLASAISTWAYASSASLQICVALSMAAQWGCTYLLIMHLQHMLRQGMHLLVSCREIL